MTRIPEPRAHLPIALLEPAEMAEADRLASRTVAGAALMERAGEAIAATVLRLIGSGGRRTVLVLCGPGNNGGDGFVAARILATAGCDVSVAMLVPRTQLKGDAAQAAARWIGPAVTLAEADFAGCDIVVDALFGAGLTRDVDGAAAAAINKANAWAKKTGKPLLAIDVPSGIDGASGAIRGVAINATDCTTFFRLKPGHVLMPGREHCGSLSLHDIGIDASVLTEIGPATFLNAPALWLADLPVPSLGGHKYMRGHAVIMSGPLSQTGAARLAARGALRAGAGLVTVATPAEALAVHAAALTAIMTRVADGAEGLRAILSDPRKNAVGLGPGLGTGEATRALVKAALTPLSGENGSARRAIVLDADALTSFADDPHELFAAIEASGHEVVLTPHDGEFATLFGSLVDSHLPKPRRTRAAAGISGSVVVLKGPDTVVADRDGRASIAASDAPWLATAGSGDVLAGMVTGLLAQGMKPFLAASAAVWMHAEAARLFGAGLISEDLPDLLPRVLSERLDVT